MFHLLGEQVWNIVRASIFGDAGKTLFYPSCRNIYIHQPCRSKNVWQTIYIHLSNNDEVEVQSCDNMRLRQDRYRAMYQKESLCNVVSLGRHE